MRLAGAGLSAEVPAGWDARIYSRPLAPPAVLPELEPSPFERRVKASGGTASLHAASFPLPPNDGDFGTGAISEMPPGGAFVAVLEYEAGGGLEAGMGLFKPRGVPAPLTAREFAPDAMLRPRPGQIGVQRFFTAEGRPFCLYAVIDRGRDPGAALGELNQLLASFRFARSLAGAGGGR